MILPRLYSERERQKIRNKRLHIDGCPTTKVTITDLAAGAEKLYGFSTNTDLRRYLPLNYIRVINESGCNLEIEMDNHDGETVVDGTIWTYSGNFYSFNLKNLDAANTATGATTYVTVQRKPTGG